MPISLSFIIFYDFVLLPQFCFDSIVIVLFCTKTYYTIYYIVSLQQNIFKNSMGVSEINNIRLKNKGSVLIQMHYFYYYLHYLCFNCTYNVCFF